MSQLIDRLAEHDPAAGADPSVPEHVLARILAEPPERDSSRVASFPQGRRFAPRRLALAGGLAVTIAAGAVVVPGLLDGSPGLAERAYAETATTDDVVLHQRRTIRLELTGNDNIPPALREQTSTLERWQHGDDSRSVLEAGGTRAETRIVDGVSTRRDADGLTSTSDPQLVEMNAAIVREDPITTFRTAFAEDKLTETGTVAFGGRTAKRFVTPEERTPAPLPVDVVAWEYFLDAETAQPLGARQTYTVLHEDGRRTVDTTTIAITTLERLRATPENVGLVTQAP